MKSRGIVGRLTVALALIASLILAPAIAGAGADGAAAAAKKAKVKVLTKSQRKILRRDAIKVRVKGRHHKLKLRAHSKTFDSQGFKTLSKRLVLRPGKSTAKLKLNRRGAEQVSSCTARTIKISGKGVKVSFDLRRTGKCKPKPIDLSQAESCDLIVVDDGAAPDSLCMLPFPDNFHTVADESTETGRLVSFDNAAMPRNSDMDPIAAAPYNLNDGFSPGQTAVIKVPGLDTPEALAATDAAPLNDLGQFERKQAPVVVIDTKTGDRWPIWVEIDSNASTPERTALLIHPSRNYESGHRYVVAMRKLRAADGDAARPARGLPLLPRRPAGRRAGRRRAAQALRQGLPGPAQGRDQAQEPVSRLGLHRLQRPEHRRAAAPHARRRLRRPRRHRPHRRRGAGRLAGLRGHLGRELHPGRGRRDGAADPGHLRGALLPDPRLRAGRQLRARGERAPEPDRDLHGRVQLRGAARRRRRPGRDPRRARRSTATGCSDRPRRRPQAISRRSARRTTSSSARPRRSGSRARTCRTSPATSSPTSATSRNSPTGSSRGCSTRSSSAG